MERECEVGVRMRRRRGEGINLEFGFGSGFWCAGDTGGDGVILKSRIEVSGDFAVSCIFEMDGFAGRLRTADEAMSVAPPYRTSIRSPSRFIHSLAFSDF